jgi:hypothetical protein
MSAQEPRGVMVTLLVLAHSTNRTISLHYASERWPLPRGHVRPAAWR